MAHKARRRSSWKLPAKDGTRNRIVLPVTIDWENGRPDVTDLKRAPGTRQT